MALEFARPNAVPDPARRSLLGEKFPVLALLALAVFGLIQIQWGERIPINDGLGWDGTVYADIALGFPKNVLHKQFSAYDVQRVLPSAVVNLGMRALHLKRNPRSVIKAFQVYNLMLLMSSALAWHLIARDLRMSASTTWLGLCFLLVNLPVLKLSFYYPVLTDTTAFALGLWLVYCFLKRNMVGTLLLCLAGALTWPTFFYSGILLYLFPKVDAGRGQTPQPARGHLNTVAATAVSALVLAAIVYTYYLRHLQLAHGNDQVNGSLILLSILAVLTYTFTSLRRALDFNDLFDLRAIGRALAWRRVIVAAALFLLIKAVVALLKGPGGYTTGELLVAAVLESVAKPAIFLVAHIVYFGPAVLFFMYYFKDICKVIHRQGIGLTLYLVFHLLLALASESRYLIVVFPAAVMLVMLLMDTIPWNASQGWLVFAACVVFSKIWLPINTQDLSGSYLAFPFQFYFMNLGPWMSELSYLIQAAGIAVIGALLYAAWFRRFPRPALSNGSA